MAGPSLSALAASAIGEWPGWVVQWVLLPAGAFWFTHQGESGGRGADPSSDASTRASEDANRIRELQDTVDELTRRRAATLEADRRRDEFLTSITHELRGPLNAILGWTQVLQPRQDLTPEVRDALAIIQRNALRQGQLLDDLVDMSRVVNGALEIEPKPMRVQVVLDQACEAARPAIERKRLRLECGPASDAIISGDAHRFQQAVRHLLANAIHHTPPGGAITVRTETTGLEVSIAVSDTGSGIDPAFLPYVFEPFRQQPGAEPRGGSTFGLGLALARIIVVGHGGRLLAHSEGPGRGATFTMLLPALPIEQRVSSGVADEPSAITPSAELAGLRVLAVDDEPDWRELLGHILGAAGADARIAASAAEAIQIFEGWRPDVVLTDIAMPGTDGYGLLASIRGRGGAGRAVPAIAMTAHAGTQERMRTGRAGFAEHLAKPIPPHELIAAVRRVADLSSRAKGVGSG